MMVADHNWFKVLIIVWVGWLAAKIILSRVIMVAVV